MLIYRAWWLEGGIVTWHLDLTLSDHRAARLKKSTVGIILESDTMYFALVLYEYADIALQFLESGNSTSWIGRFLCLERPYLYF